MSHPYGPAQGGPLHGQQQPQPYGYGPPQPAPQPYAQPYAPQPAYGQHYPPQPAPGSRNWIGIISLILGIACLAMPLLPNRVINLLIAAAAIAFGAAGRARAKTGTATNPGVCLAGIICGVLGFAATILIMSLD